MTGKIGGNPELNGDAGRGTFWVKDLAARELAVKRFPVPDLDVQKGWLEADLKGDRLTIRKLELELEGKDLTIRPSGDLALHARGMLNLLVRLKPSERLSREQAGVVGLLKNRDAQGFYQLTLGGTLDAPLPRVEGSCVQKMYPTLMPTTSSSERGCQNTKAPFASRSDFGYRMPS